MRHLTAFLAGIGVAFFVGIAGGRIIRRAGAQAGLTTIDLNRATANDLVALGLDRLIADRIVENRPYRSRLELVSRVMLPHAVYDSIKSRVSVSATDEPVKVAS